MSILRALVSRPFSKDGVVLLAVFFLVGWLFFKCCFVTSIWLLHLFKILLIPPPSFFFFFFLFSCARRSIFFFLLTAQVHVVATDHAIFGITSACFSSLSWSPSTSPALWRLSHTLEDGAQVRQSLLNIHFVVVGWGMVFAFVTAPVLKDMESDNHDSIMNVFVSLLVILGVSIVMLGRLERCEHECVRFPNIFYPSNSYIHCM